MSEIQLPANWPYTYSPVLVDLLATVTLDHVEKHRLSHGSYEARRDPHYALQSRAVQLLARELAARLATGDADYSGDPYDDVFFDLRNTRGNMLVGAGAPKADFYLGVATSHGHRGGAVVTGPQLTVTAYQNEVGSVIVDAAALAADVVASAARDVALDAELDSDFAGDIAADFAAARAGYLATLQARFPDRGFV